MRFLVFLLVMLFLGGCGEIEYPPIGEHLPTPPPEPTNTPEPLGSTPGFPYFDITPTRSHLQIPTSTPTPTATAIPEFVYSVAQVNGGSGFFVEYKGLWLVTNYHVIEDEDGDIFDAVSVKLSKSNIERDAKVVEVNEDLDLALLLVDSPFPFEPLSIRTFGAIVGENVKVVGFPKGYLITRSGNVEKVDEERIETNIKEVNRLQSTIGGHSGGPVLDEDGKVVGVHWGRVEGTNIALAVPIHHVLELIDRRDNA